MVAKYPLLHDPPLRKGPDRGGGVQEQPPLFLESTDAARRWKLRGWTGSSGPVSNVPLWELLLDTLSAHTGSIKFIKVPSHVDILGNNEGDRLADQGRLSHLRCPVLKTPSRDFIMPTYTPPTKRQRRTTVAELDSIVQALNFSPYKDSMGGSVVYWLTSSAIVA